MCITKKELASFAKNTPVEQTESHELSPKTNTSGELPSGSEPASQSNNATTNTATASTDHNDVNEQPNSSDAASQRVSWALCWRIYLSHFLSTWNSRAFEFAAVLFLANIFPGTLLPLSIYALVRSAAAIAFSTPVGNAIDRRDRLPVVRFSIVCGRVTVVLSCVLFYVLYTHPSWQSGIKYGVLVILVVLSCFEKVASVMNLVAVERDWVVVIASSDEPALQKLNARMRRIDLICKLVGPLFIALIDGASTAAAILLLLGSNAVSVFIEYVAIFQVYKMTPALASRRNLSAIDVPSRITIFPRPPRRAKVIEWMKAVYHTFKFYFSHRACLPSFALSWLYFTVLSFGGQMITYLVAAGYNSYYIALTRSLSVVFEISATWIAPWVMRKIGPIRAGLWFINWQMLLLGATVVFFWSENNEIVVASGLSGGTILSRIGLWGFDLSAQVIIQNEVVENSRGSFSTTEQSFQNFFELLSYVLTIVWSKPSEFKYPVVISAAAVYTAGILYAFFLRRRRGHIIHIPCGKPVVDFPS